MNIAVALPEFQSTSTSTGCVGVRTPSGVHRPCGKIPAPGSTLCPKCQLLTDDLAGERARRAEKASRTRAFREAREEALSNSPLKAFNPEFDKRHSGEY
jgi:hypothetical protein